MTAYSLTSLNMPLHPNSTPLWAAGQIFSKPARSAQNPLLSPTLPREKPRPSPRSHDPTRSGPTASLPSPPASLAPLQSHWPSYSQSVTSCLHIQAQRWKRFLPAWHSFWGTGRSEGNEHTGLSPTPGPLHTQFLLRGPGFQVSVLITPLQRPSLPC